MVTWSVCARNDSGGTVVCKCCNQPTHHTDQFHRRKTAHCRNMWTLLLGQMLKISFLLSTACCNELENRERQTQKEKWNEDIGMKAEKMTDKEIEANERIPSNLSSTFRCLILVFSVMALSLWNMPLTYPRPLLKLTHTLPHTLFHLPLTCTVLSLHHISFMATIWVLFNFFSSVSLQSYTNPLSSGLVLLPHPYHNPNHLQLVTESMDATWNPPFLNVATHKIKNKWPSSQIWVLGKE